MKFYSMPMADVLVVNEICDVIRTSGGDDLPKFSDAGYGDSVLW